MKLHNADKLAWRQLDGAYRQARHQNGAQYAWMDGLRSIHPGNTWGRACLRASAYACGDVSAIGATRNRRAFFGGAS